MRKAIFVMVLMLFAYAVVGQGEWEDEQMLAAALQTASDTCDGERARIQWMRDRAPSKPVVHTVNAQPGTSQSKCPQIEEGS